MRMHDPAVFFTLMSIVTYGVGIAVGRALDRELNSPLEIARRHWSTRLLSGALIALFAAAFALASTGLVFAVWGLGTLVLRVLGQ